MGLKRALLSAVVACGLPLAAGAGLIAAPTGPAQAQPVTGLYIGGGVGMNLLQSTDVRRGGDLGEVDWQAGVAALVNLGWGFGNGLRAEVEGGYRWNHIDKAGLSPAAAAPFSGALGRFHGSQRTISVMANLLYDIPLFGPAPPVTPYVGGGVGWAWMETNKLRATSDVFGLRFASDDWDNRFAYQGIAGLAFNLVPGLAVTAEYRFFGTLAPEFSGRAIPLTAAAIPRSGAGTVEVDNYNHSIMLGIRYAFNAPLRVARQQVAPPATLVPNSTYLVFFDWDRADLTARARDIIGQAAAASRTQQTTRLEVAGHADRSGTVPYNQRLSQRRADNVAAELVRQGVPRGAISVTAYGETRPLVPTADGVREPQNRRVEIVLR